MYRSTRSKSRSPEKVDPVITKPDGPFSHYWVSKNQSKQTPAELLLKDVTSKSTGLSKKDVSLLLLKRQKLRMQETQLKGFIKEVNQAQGRHASALVSAAQATLVFGQEEAGTAVCISPSGLLLTCSHCVADDEKEAFTGKSKWLLLATGEIVKAKCVAWDAKRDLALLQIEASEPPALNENDKPQESGLLVDHKSSSGPVFPYVTTPPTGYKLKVRAPLNCIGHPGSEDFEADMPGVQTGYDVLHISEGRYRGLAPGQDPQDNSEIGALCHDCWTYWGHSGGPLTEGLTGRLVGLHSSWDDQTAMRRGVPLEAILSFLSEHANPVEVDRGT